MYNPVINKMKYMRCKTVFVKTNVSLNLDSKNIVPIFFKRRTKFNKILIP